MTNVCRRAVVRGLGAGLLTVFSASAFCWAPADSPGTDARMLTEWGAGVCPDNAWRSYPRPQMVRDGWTCLNGLWDYAVTAVTNTPGRPMKWDGQILVPFGIESSLSGVGRLLQPQEFLWYHRKITCSPEVGHRVLLHFEGVDFRTMVFIGHREVTDVPHSGAQEPFTLDITDFVKAGENDLTLCVWDPTEGFANSRGKQSLEPKSCFYSRCSGIWQTVWMENVPTEYIGSYRIATDIDGGEVRLEVEKKGGSGRRMSISAFDGDKKIGDFTPVSDSTYSLHLDSFECWSPENPKLYSFSAKYGDDKIRGYFGMRKIEKRRDERGMLRFFLNNKPYFILGTLDQGWWPDGLLTPPSDDAMAFDIQTLKNCGFNAMRKHIKVESRRYYHLCDRMGILVLQDLPCFNVEMHGPLRADTIFGYGFQRRELKAMVDVLGNVPSIVMWIPYNEGWSQPGEFLTHATLDWLSGYDPTRLVDGPSGAWDFEGGHCLPGSWDWNERVLTEHKGGSACEAGDVIDMHAYPGPAMFEANGSRISFLGEFGGLGHPVAGHLWKTLPSGEYCGFDAKGGTDTRSGLEKAYRRLMSQVAELVERGLGGCVYTQTADVEIEVNGIMTYDRKVLKLDPEVLKSCHDEIRRKAE